MNLLTDLMECWNQLDGRVIELTSWVGIADSSLPGESQIGKTSWVGSVDFSLPGESQTWVGSVDFSLPGKS